MISQCQLLSAKKKPKRKKNKFTLTVKLGSTFSIIIANLILANVKKNNEVSTKYSIEI